MQFAISARAEFTARGDSVIVYVGRYCSNFMREEKRTGAGEAGSFARRYERYSCL